MQIEPEIVCLCGSTRFMDHFHAAGWQFTLEGLIVLSVGVCKHAEHHGAEALGPDMAARLDELHLRKIDLANFVYVLNVDGYIGESTTSEIAYAIATGKDVRFLEAKRGEVWLIEHRRRLGELIAQHLMRRLPPNCCRPAKTVMCDALSYEFPQAT